MSHYGRFCSYIFAITRNQMSNKITLRCASDYRDTSHTSIVSDDLLSYGKNRIFTNTKRRKQQVFQYNGEILYGIHPVYLALTHPKRTFYHLYMKDPISLGSSQVSKSKLKEEILHLAASLQIKSSYVDTHTLRLLASGAVHQGVCLDVSEYPLIHFDEMKSPYSKYHPLWLILHEIQDPMNIGAVLRSAHYFGVDKVFLTLENSCRLSPIVSKASSGALEVLDIYQISNLEKFIEKRKSEGMLIVSSVAKDSESADSVTLDIHDFQLSKPTILILGNESVGISKSVLSLCDLCISIRPDKEVEDSIDSLNVSVATGIMLYHMLNRRKSKDC